MDVNVFNALTGSKISPTSLAANQPQAQPESKAGGEFKPVETAKEFASAVANSERAASAYMVGKADPHSVVEAIASAELAVETAVTVRNRVVEAYQELLRMPI